MQEKKMKYQRYKRGQIVLIDFSPSMGSELRGKHFAIVITKKDSPNNGVLTVIPLSSKEKPYYLDIGNFVSKQVYPQLLNITRELYTALAIWIHLMKMNTTLKTFKKSSIMLMNLKKSQTYTLTRIKNHLHWYKILQQ